ncbi:hypothetical protein C8R43DRAFT_909870, partial [Mycena crocata]
SVISGSVPVAVMKDLSFLPTDVDIYVPESQEATMHDVVLNRLGFSRSRDAIVRYPEYMGIRKIQWFTKGASKINLMIVAGENPLLSIIKFHSTIVMNIVTFRGFLILFPDMSADGLSLANSQQLLDYRHFKRTMECINRYRERGIVFATNVGTHRLKISDFAKFKNHKCGVDPNCPQTLRTLHDGHGRFYALKSHKPDLSIEGSTYDPYDGKQSVAWSIGGPACAVGSLFHQTFVVPMAMAGDKVSGF